MSKLTSIALSLLILVQSIQITSTDIWQLDDLFVHALEHQQKTGDSLFQFISLHYGNQKISHNQEHSQHKNLPFQQEIDVLSSTTFYFQEVNLVSNNSIIQNLKKSRFYYQGFFSIFELRTLFQPPITI
ncbi:MAG: hypothetical protein KAI79_12890 [Bacteroidales bacterium]|nr:hypothetical protein [Bacteroidales bacterium]